MTSRPAHMTRAEIIAGYNEVAEMRQLRDAHARNCAHALLNDTLTAARAYAELMAKQETAIDEFTARLRAAVVTDTITPHLP